MFKKLEELEVYQLAERLGDAIWDSVIRWDYFAKDTVGKQLVRAADSIAANLSEGYGRYSYRENIQFCYYARGSLEETRNWIRRAIVRKLSKNDEIENGHSQIDTLGRKLNA
jgi:four helix bundle protein